MVYSLGRAVYMYMYKYKARPVETYAETLRHVFSKSSSTTIILIARFENLLFSEFFAVQYLYTPFLHLAPSHVTIMLRACETATDPVK